MKVFNLFSSKESFCECRTNAAEKVPFIDLLMCTVFFKHNQKPVLLQYISDMDQAVVIQPFQVSWDSFKSTQNSLRSLGMTFELVKYSNSRWILPKTKIHLVTTDFHFMCRCYRLNNHYPTRKINAELLPYENAMFVMHITYSLLQLSMMVL